MSDTSKTTVIPVDPAFAAPAKRAGYVVKRRVSMPVLPFANNTAIVCRISDPIHTGKEIEDTKKGPIAKAADVCVIMSPSGEYRTLIVGEVLKRELQDAYPDDSYVGLWFHIAKHAPREARRYADYTITEIEAPQTAEGSLAPSQAA